MPNDFSVVIHNYLKSRIFDSEEAANNSDHAVAEHARGQLEELLWIRKYLKENIDLKNFVYY
jgi:hypothetical protein